MSSDRLVLSLNIGDVKIARGPASLTTILGSCVSVCLYSSKTQIGGMTHFALPDETGTPDSDKMKYGSNAIPALIQMLHKMNPHCKLDLRAKVVGGASTYSSRNENWDIGALNVDMARRLLKHHRIPIVAEDTGGARGRKIQFLIPEGKLKIQDLRENPHPDDVLNPIKVLQQLTSKTVWSPSCSKKILVIGASTGGTEALKDVLTRLPAQIPPTLIVQHIPPTFSRAFADRLNEMCPFEVKEAEDGDVLKPGAVFIAPGGLQMRLKQRSDGTTLVQLTDDPAVNRHKPSVDYLFDSVVQLFGRKTVAVLLTGMGADGAQGLLKLRKAGASTIAQDEKSSVVFGMPKAAQELGAAQKVCSLGQVPSEILKALCQVEKKPA